MQAETKVPILYIHPKVKELLEIDRLSPCQGTPEWLASRVQRITASEGARAEGIDPYCSREAYIAKKVTSILDEKSPAKLGEASVANAAANPALAHGHKYEDEALAQYCELTGLTVFRFGFMKHPTISFLGGSPDGVTNTGILLEVKCPYRRKIVQDQMPDMYIPQIQLLMEIMELDAADFIEYKPPEVWREGKFNVVRKQRDTEWFSKRLPMLQSTMDEVNRRVRLMSNMGTLDLENDEPEHKRVKLA